MVVTFATRILLVLCLFCVLFDVAFSRQRKPNNKESLMQIIGRKLPDVRRNSSGMPLAPSPNYLINLVHRNINATTPRGNYIAGFTVNDSSSDLHFKFHINVIRTRLLRFAELLLYKLPSTLDANPNSTATVHIKDIYSGKRLSTRRVSMATTGWISFSIPLHIIRRWDRRPASNAGLAVQIVESSLAPAIRFATKQTNPNLQLLFLIHYTDEGFRSLPPISIASGIKPSQRSPRSVHPSHKGSCKRHKLDVYFKDLGWDEWVISPKMYSAYYCAGKCDISNLKSNHAGIQMYISQNEPALTNAPCCVPDKMGSISMLFYGGPSESDYVLQDMKEFVVESCGCF